MQDTSVVHTPVMRRRSRPTWVAYGDGDPALGPASSSRPAHDTTQGEQAHVRTEEGRVGCDPAASPKVDGRGRRGSPGLGHVGSLWGRWWGIGRVGHPHGRAPELYPAELRPSHELLESGLRARLRTA